MPDSAEQPIDRIERTESEQRLNPAASSTASSSASRTSFSAPHPDTLRPSEREERFALVSQIARRMYAGESISSIIQLAVDGLLRIFPDCLCSYSTLDANGRLTILYSNPPGETVSARHSELTLPRDWFDSLDDRGLLVVDDIQVDPQTRHLASALGATGTHAFLSAPVSHRAEVTGVLAFCSNGPRAWSEKEQVVLSDVVSFLAIALEAAERKRQLSESESKFRTLAEQSDINITLLQEGQIMYANPAMLRMTGYTAAELTQIHQLDLVHPDDRSYAEQRASRRFDGDPMNDPIVLRIQAKDGRVRWIEFRGSTIDIDGVPTLLSSGVDVTQRKQAEDKLRHAKEAAEAGNRAKSLFLTNMSHELRTPLNSVIGFANILRRNKGGRLDEKDLTYLERIARNGRDLLHLIDEILDLSKIEAGKIEIQSQLVQLDALIQETVRELEGQVQSPDLQLSVQLPEHTLPVRTDQNRLKQVLVNLVGNAIKFTAKGNVVVRLGTDSNGRPAWIEVQDTGIGIPEEKQQVIFEAFRQADSDISRTYGGTGLGLNISASLSKLLGCEIRLKSQPGEGSTFRVVLPVAPGTERSVSEW